MKLIRSTIAALTVMSCANIVQAQDAPVENNQTKDNGIYGALGGVIFNPDLYGVEAKLGYDFNKYFGVEAQGSVGLNTDSDRLFDSPNSASFSQKVDYSMGVFAVGRLPLNKQFEVFARVGLHNTKTSETINNALMSDFGETETNFAVGGGAQYNFDEKNGVRAEYTYLGGLGGGTVSLGYVRKF